MKPYQTSRLIRTLCAVLALLLCMLTLMVGCASPKALLSLGKQSVSVNMYELMLSRMKGSLASSGFPYGDNAAWDQIISESGMTWNDYFCISIQEEAANMLAKLYLYEEVYQLSLSSSQLQQIDTFISEVIELNYDGSKTAFNQELAAYGVNVDILRENYILEDKIEHLTAYVSSMTGDAAREEYYQNNYFCFKQILFPTYEYLYETDENGDLIYYVEGSTKIAYAKSGATKTGTDGKLLTDENGDVIYFTEDGRIAYDTQKGVIAGLDKDLDGYIDYAAYDEETVAVIKDRVHRLEELIVIGDFSTFEDYGDQFSEDEVWSSYPNGIYLHQSKSYPLNYFDDMQAALAKMAVGETAVIQSENAYHLIMKYELAPSGYSDEASADWFTDFEKLVAEGIVENLCQKYVEQIVLDENALASAMDMKTVGTNTDY